MVRLGKSFACAALMATVMAIASGHAAAQTTAPVNQQPAASPKATPSTTTKTSSTGKARSHHKKAAAVAEVPQTPPTPQTLEQQPPIAPQVSYRNGQLTIDAANSTLSSILRAIQVQTGATMDIPAGANGERVAMRLGPGQPRDVLHTLLNGSRFDYMILGVAGNPGAIQKVILTPKQAGGAAVAQASNNAQPASDDQDDGSQVADTGGESEYPGPTPDQGPTPPGAIRRPMGAPGAQQFNRPGDNPFPAGQSDNVVKTPEQLMQELQEMQQQQQQYQDQLNPANQNPPQ